MRLPNSQCDVTLRYRGHVTNKISYISTFTRPMYPKLSRVVTQDDRTPPTKSRDSSISRSRDKIKNVISQLSQALCTPKLGGRCLRMREPHPQSHVTHQPLGHVTTQIRYISTFNKAYGSQTQQDTGYSVVITIGVCAEGNWLIEASVYFYPSLSKEYNISNVKEAAGMQRKAGACRK